MYHLQHFCFAGEDMAKRHSIFELAVGPTDAWREEMSRLQAQELQEVLEQVRIHVQEFTAAVRRLQLAAGFVEGRLERLRNEAEKEARRQRRVSCRVTLRNFLGQPFREQDVRLADLSLCTRTGAAVRLEALTFKTGAGAIRATGLNEAKELFKTGAQLFRALGTLHT